MEKSKNQQDRTRNTSVSIIMEAADITTINSELMFFTPPLVNKGITNVSFSESRPVNSISDGIEISLKASGLQYLDLERCRLKV